MSIPNVFNVASTTNGITVILPGVPTKRHRIRQLKIQNQDNTNSTTVSIESYNEETSTVNETIIGPLLIKAGETAIIELASEEDEAFLQLERGQALAVSKADTIAILAYGYDNLS